MRNLLLILLLSCYSFIVRGQTRISGIVTDNQDNPLPGANVFISTLHLGSATDDNGKYEITVPQEESQGQSVNLKAQYIGYKSQTVIIALKGDSIEQNFSLKEDVFQSDEVVVTGLASKTSKGRAEVSVSRIDAAGLEKTSSFQAISQMVEGQISGVQVSSSSGNVGGGFRFYVRGGGGLNGDEQPVVYVDGVRVLSDELTGLPNVGGQGISTLSILSPENIEKIQMLKGPAAAAMYGTSGSNGVVLITTKTGRSYGSRNLSVNYKFAYGLNTQAYKYKTSNFLSANSANAIFRDGMIRQNNLSLSGGTNLLSYYTSFDDRYEEGNIPNNSINRKALRANLISYPSQYLTLKISSAYSLTDYKRPLNDGTHWGVLMNVLAKPKSYSFTDSAAVFQIKDEYRIESFTGGVQLTFTPLTNLEFYFNGGIDNSYRRQDQTYPQNLFINGINNGRRTIFNGTDKEFTYDIHGSYSYDLLKELQTKSTIGVQLFEDVDREAYVQSEDFETNLITDVGAGSTQAGSEAFYNTREAGIFTANNFAYKNQYFLSLGLREDYASSIGPEAPSILYPKVSFALRFDKYDWFPSSLFGLFKLRAAYGENGKLPGDLASIPLLWGARNVGGKVGAVIYNIGNSSIKPERIKEFETGLDFEFLKNYSIELTYYRQNATNSIFYNYESPSTGLTERPVPFNVGGIKNWGFESLLQASLISSKNYELDLRLIWNYQNNKVTSLGGSAPMFASANVIKEGLPKHEFYVHGVTGAKFDSAGIYLGPNHTAERQDFGNPIANHTGSFSIKFRFLKNFNFYALMDWALNRKMWNQTKMDATQNGNVPEYNILQAQLGITKDHQEIARLTPGTQEYINAANRYAKLDPSFASNYIEDAGYFKIREFSLSYSLKDLLTKTGYNYLKDVVVGISALNVWTFTKYSGADVELNTLGSRSLVRGTDFYTLQHPRVYNMWISVSL